VKQKKKHKNEEITVALSGNPNVGKSTVFNALTHLKQHTGNWSGKTVETKGGRFTFKDKSFYIVDLPGTYSLLSDSKEEEIARNFLCFENPDTTVIVADATCLERNLNLVLQILEITDNAILCLNLIDEATKKGIKIDDKKLSEILNIPVVLTSALNKSGIDNLKKEIYKTSLKNNEKTYKVKYNELIENAISSVEGAINFTENKRFFALKLLDGEKSIINSVSNKLGFDILESENIMQVLSKEWNDLEKNGIKKSEICEICAKKIIKDAERIATDVITVKSENYNERDKKIDKILTSKKFGIPIMLFMLTIILYITVKGANYPSNLLFNFFDFLGIYIDKFLKIIHTPRILNDMLINGVYRTVSWVIAVMLPPMAIFFPLFTLFEDLGVLPRIAFNLDNVFKKASTCGKQCLTMCMGLGCNSVGVMGARIINSPRERLIAIITNSFVPCNGKFPTLIAISSIFIASFFAPKMQSIVSCISVLFIILLGVFVTLIVSKILSKTLLKGESSHFFLELPPYRKPKVFDIIYRSVFDRTLFVLSRACMITAPCAVIIWIFANTTIGSTSVLGYLCNFLNPIGTIMGIDGVILLAFILGIPANEIVLPIALMCYLSSSSLLEVPSLSEMSKILIANGWTVKTAICTMVFSLLHFPCSTTLLTIYKETKSLKWTFVSFILPTVIGFTLCTLINLIFCIF